jgi:Spy/CpxP family protein refolding chaperone
MKKTWLSALVVGLVAALVSFAVARRTGPAQVPRLDALDDVEWLNKTLHLTPSQLKEIGALQPEFGRKLSTCCDRHCKARGQLLSSLLISTNGIEGARTLVEEMCRAQADSELATLEHIRGVYQILTPEQQAVFKEQLSAMTCTECPACAGATCGRMAKGTR